MMPRWIRLSTVATTGLLATAALFLGPAAPAIPDEAAADEPTATFRNPLKVRNGADPWLTYHDGWYYLATTTATDIRLHRARRIGELKDAPGQVVWRDDHPERFRDIWASEFFRLDPGDGGGPRWYVYYTASDGEDSHHRMYVAESAGDDPLGPYSFKAKLITDPVDADYAIDGTVMRHADGTLYFIWCGRPSPVGQGLYIARMSNPWTVDGPRVYLEADGFGCDVVREGPVTLHRNGKVFLVYSACGADTPDYRLGMLIANEDADPMDPDSWAQHPEPVFSRVDEHGVYGPGHNTFFRSPDGTEDWITYHAKTTTERTYADRSTRAQPFTWNPDGTPNFGTPLPLDAEVPVPSGEPPAR